MISSLGMYNSKWDIFDIQSIQEFEVSVLVMCLILPYRTKLIEIVFTWFEAA